VHEPVVGSKGLAPDFPGTFLRRGDSPTVASSFDFNPKAGLSEDTGVLQPEMFSLANDAVGPLQYGVVTLRDR